MTSGRDGLGPVGPLRRLAAIVAIAALLAGVGVVLLVLAHNILAAVLVALGLGTAVTGGWWIVTETMPRRAVGALVASTGLIVVIATLFVAFNETSGALLRSAGIVLLLVLAGGAAQFALLPDLHRIDAEAKRRDRPHRAVLLCNPWSGGGKVERFGLVELAAELGVETVMLDHGLDLEALAREAVARGADCLGMAGGDGSQALVASIAVEHDLPFVCITAGTRNHFALDLGLDRDDPRASMLAFRDAVERRVDYATVGDRLFVNNVSLGVYATVVQEESYREAKGETARNLLPELLGRQAEPFDLQFTKPNGEEVDGAFLVQVSNNPYVLGMNPDAAQRLRLDTGRLGVFAVTTRTGADAARLFALTAVGQRNWSPDWHEFVTDEFEIRSRSGRALVGVDGEALELDTPLRFGIHRLGLRLLVPEGNIVAAARRRARRIDTRALLTVAAGRRPEQEHGW